MKCPKCGYISFDYNQLCPKCNKNISAEHAKFNLPSFRPDPPALLGFLIGEANESNVSISVPPSHLSRMSSGGVSLNDSIVLHQDSMDVEGQDLDLSFETEEAEESEEEDIFAEDEELDIAPEKVMSDADLHLEKKGGGEVAFPGGDEDDLSLDLGELALDESVEVLDKMDVEIGAAAIPGGGLDEIESEIELDLDDLKIDDMGDLGIGSDMPSVGEMERTMVDTEEDDSEPEFELSVQDEDLPDISELVLDEAVVSDQAEKTMILDDFSLDSADEAEKEGDLALGEIKLDDIELGEEGLMELEDLDAGEGDSDTKGQSMLFEDLDINDSSELEKSFDLSDISIGEDYSDSKPDLAAQESLSDSGDLEKELDALSLDVDEYQKKGNRDDFDLDLDDMDIDLDLDEPKK